MYLHLSNFLVSKLYLHLAHLACCGVAHNIQHHRPLYCFLGKLFSFFLIVKMTGLERTAVRIFWTKLNLNFLTSCYEAVTIFKDVSGMGNLTASSFSSPLSEWCVTTMWPVALSHSWLRHRRLCALLLREWWAICWLCRNQVFSQYCVGWSSGGLTQTEQA